MRRMFSTKITEKSSFLKMPLTSQALYFHLGINADDDGVVEAFKIMRMLGANEDDLKVLASKNFIKILNADLVTFILDWREHNWIRSDRKTDSIYKDLLVRIMPEVELIEPVIDKMLTNDGHLTVKSPHKLSKDKLSKDKEYKHSKEDFEIIMDFFNQTFQKSFKNIKSFAKNADYWLDIYSLDDIKKAILIARKDKFWLDKMTPVIFFRRRNPNQEDVDKIGDFLNKDEKPKVTRSF